MAKVKYQAIRDTREQKNYWTFDENSECKGTVVKKLDSGDYSLVGYENILSVERKFSTGELSGNLTDARFERELDRLDLLPHSFLILEFDWADVLSFPRNSGIPQKIWPKLKVTSNYLVKRLTEIDLNHNLSIIYAGRNSGKDRTEIIFRYIVQKYGGV